TDIISVIRGSGRHGQRCLWHLVTSSPSVIAPGPLYQSNTRPGRLVLFHWAILARAVPGVESCSSCSSTRNSRNRTAQDALWVHSLHYWQDRGIESIPTQCGIVSNNRLVHRIEGGGVGNALACLLFKDRLLYPARQ